MLQLGVSDGTVVSPSCASTSPVSYGVPLSVAERIIFGIAPLTRLSQKPPMQS